MRCFISIDLREHHDYLCGLQRELKGGRFTLTKDFHCTLRFLGEIEGSESYITRLQTIRHIPLKLELLEIGMFPSQKDPRVIWLGIGGALNSLKNEVDRALSGKSEDFKPHITLARVRFINDREQFIESIGNIKTEKKEVWVSSFSLFKSTLTREGPVHEELARFDLCG